MPGPAARMGDQTAHGGVIVAGAPTVLIGGQPAARLTDMHTCPMQTPAPVPVPHVGGPIVGPGVPTVLICGLPAATVGDMVTCVGPPDTIVKGCTTVLINAGGGGGAGGGAGMGKSGSGGKKGDSKTKGSKDTKTSKQSDTSSSTDSKEQKTDFLKIVVQDEGGKPIVGLNYDVKGPKETGWSGMLGGRVERNMVESGDHEVTLTGIADIRWSTNRIKDDEKVKMQVKLIGFDNGSPAKLRIFEQGPGGRGELFAELDAKINDDAIEVEWQYPWEDQPPEQAVAKLPAYYVPRYYFECVAGQSRSKSDLLDYRTTVEFSLKDADDKEVADAPYLVHLCNGEVRDGKLDSSGKARIDNMPPGPWAVEFPKHGSPFEK